VSGPTPGQLFSAGAGVLLTGSTPTRRTHVRYRFVEDERYLVICNPVDSINAWMFGVVNVVTQR
jgi:hypothetical protein